MGLQTQSLGVATQPVVSRTLEAALAEARGIPGESCADLAEAKPRLDCSLPGLGLGRGLSVTVVRPL